MALDIALYEVDGASEIYSMVKRVDPYLDRDSCVDPAKRRQPVLRSLPDYRHVKFGTSPVV